ncbi:MAG: hypothetical protein L0207_04275 [Chlamydiae bacterium]|nr:hypothetical protein [Chlamydiota bacterium]
MSRATSTFYFLFFLILFSCSGMEESEKQKIRQLNAKGEYIHRNHNEFNYRISSPKQIERERYPWEGGEAGNIVRRITKESFRCKGSLQNPAIEGTFHMADCGGSQAHSLPLKNGKEFIYPVLIDLLNYIQDKTGKKVKITCGHRCPTHNTYSDDSISGRISKHMIGAEVDFYVKGMEWTPDRIINVILQYYKDTPKYAGKKSYQEFTRLDKAEVKISKAPWVNKEIIIKIYKEKEGRDWDNRHAYPYISIQVCHDKELKEKVVYTWQKAFNGYLRY